MMQDYDFLPLMEEQGTNTSSNAASTNVQPSEQVVKNILDFARCCQRISTQDVELKFCLN